MKYLNDYYRKNRDILLQKSKEYYLTDKGKEVRLNSSRRYWTDPKNKFKNKARYTLNNALKRGEILKPSACEKCGYEGYIEGHHIDYSKPFDVIWLCKVCHENEHHLNEGQLSNE